MGTTCCLGLDLGTTHVKSVALSPEGRALAEASRPVSTAAPLPGRAEQDAEEVWSAAAAVLREAVAAVGPGSVSALALSGAMHTCLPASADGSPLAPSLTWADRRAADACRRLRARVGLDGLAGLYRRTGCPLQPLYHLPKLRWFLEEAPERARRAALFVMLKDWVLRRLSGEWLADWSTWSSSGLLDIHACRWDPEALELAGVGPDRLPPLASPFSPAGRLTAEAARATGLPRGLPLFAGASDGALANLGSGAILPGESVITVGTSGAVRRWAAEPRLDARQRTWCYLLDAGRWFAGGAINNAGLAVQWVREQFYGGRESGEGYRELMAEAARVPPGADGVRCLPFFSGERNPNWRADARAAFIGLGWEHRPRHLARAVLEAVAFRLADLWEALGAPPEGGPVRLTGGIVRSSAWAQLLCDVLGVELAAVQGADASAVGAALVAQAALNPRLSLEALAARIHPGVRWRPVPARHETYRGVLEEFRELYRRLVDHPGGGGEDHGNGGSGV